MGQSQGAWISAFIAVTRPDLVKGLVLVDSASLTLPEGGECQDFRVWSGIMGKQGVPYVSTQRACHPK